jgi:phosphoribosylglycinamide formyltransferase-1
MSRNDISYYRGIIVKKINIAVLVSGGGSNLQALIDGIKNGSIKNAQIALVVSSNSLAYALTRAELMGIPSKVFDPLDYKSEECRNAAIEEALILADTDLVVLAGYMRILSPALVAHYKGRIVNIHPSLIPKHCGVGYYGNKVHEAVLAAGDEHSGATVHFVDEGVDTGEIILQRKAPVLPGDTAESLAARVLEVEHEIIVEAVRRICDESID